MTYRTDPLELAKCVGSLRGDGVCDITVVDNSPDHTLQEVCSGMDVSYVRTGRNIGYGAAHNIAMRRSLELKADYHLVINSDVYFSPGTIPSIVARMEGDGNVGQLMPRTVYPDGMLQYNVRPLPTPADLILRRFLPRWMCRRSRRRYTLADWDHLTEANVPYHQGSFMFLRVKALERVGLFDERFFMYPEDIDLTRRIHRHFTTLYFPQATVVHAHRAASYKSLKMLWIHMANMVRYFNKWGWIYDAERSKANRQLFGTLRM